MVNLDMTDPSQQCPSAWMEYSSGGVRACERIQNVAGGCDRITFIQQIAHTIRPVEELLATKLEAQLLLDGPLNRPLTHTISMD